MSSQFIKGKHNPVSIKEQVANLNKKGAAQVQGGKVKNIKNAFASAKKKSGTLKTGSNRGS